MRKLYDGCVADVGKGSCWDASRGSGLCRLAGMARCALPLLAWLPVAGRRGVRRLEFSSDLRLARRPVFCPARRDGSCSPTPARPARDDASRTTHRITHYPAIRAATPPRAVSEAGGGDAGVPGTARRHHLWTTRAWCAPRRGSTGDPVPGEPNPGPRCDPAASARRIRRDTGGVPSRTSGGGAPDTGRRRRVVFAGRTARGIRRGGRGAASDAFPARSCRGTGCAQRRNADPRRSSGSEPGHAYTIWMLRSTTRARWRQQGRGCSRCSRW